MTQDDQFNLERQLDLSRLCLGLNSEGLVCCYTCPSGDEGTSTGPKIALPVSPLWPRLRLKPVHLSA